MKLIKLIAVASLALSIGACQNKSDSNEKNGKKAWSVVGLATGNTYEAHLIPMDSANNVIGSYLASITTNGSVKPQELQSRIMDVSVLRKYLLNTSITNIKGMFVHTLDYINSGQGQWADYKNGALTITFAGCEAKGNYIFASGNMVSIIPSVPKIVSFQVAQQIFSDNNILIAQN